MTPHQCSTYINFFIKGLFSLFLLVWKPKGQKQACQPRAATITHHHLPIDQFKPSILPPQASNCASEFTEVALAHLSKPSLQEPPLQIEHSMPFVFIARCCNTARPHAARIVIDALQKANIAVWPNSPTLSLN